MEEFMAHMPPDPGAGLNVTHHDEMMANLLHRVAGWMRTRRPATPEEAGDLFAYLASDQASYVSGQTIVIDGAAAL
jgi:NAD(P)-dependent dehydrogenase (short-subunit alcohol dehydrogenase family)